MDIKKNLNTEKNYKRVIDLSNINVYLKTYIKTMTFIINYTDKNLKDKTNINCIIIRELETFTHVFRLLLLSTKNIKLTENNCHQSIFYFLEFIGQIKMDTNLFLQLNSRDATIFVYKKTIFKINKKYIKKDPKNHIFFNFFNDFIDLFLYISRNYFMNSNTIEIDYFLENIQKIFLKILKIKDFNKLKKKIIHIIKFFKIIEKEENNLLYLIKFVQKIIKHPVKNLDNLTKINNSLQKQNINKVLNIIFN